MHMSLSVTDLINQVFAFQGGEVKRSQQRPQVYVRPFEATRL